VHARDHAAVESSSEVARGQHAGTFSDAQVLHYSAPAAQTLHRDIGSRRGAKKIVALVVYALGLAVVLECESGASRKLYGATLIPIVGFEFGILHPDLGAIAVVMSLVISEIVISR
jgi:hypothetical protein